MWPFKKKQFDGFWEPRFQALAEYNAEIGRGIIHTKEYGDKMKALQLEYDAKLNAYHKRIGVIQIG